MEAKKIKVRFPPSPTGEWHFGNIRTFVFNYLFAKKHGGEIVLRFEDTDVARNKPGADASQIEILKMMGMDFDEGPYYQSKRTEIYRKELKRLLEEGKVYEAEENQAGTGKVIRMKNPEREISWHDLIKGEIKISTKSFADEQGNSDFIIARSINDPLYHFTVVVDDWLMGITHVLRGEDHVTSTPRQIIILEALGANIPLYGHLPTILGENKKKLGKRNGAIPVREYFEMGYIADAILNAISLLGWNPGDEREIFSRQELIDAFSLERVQKNPAIFTGEKLDYINKEHLKKLSADRIETEIISRFREDIKKHPLIKKVVPLVFERISKWNDIEALLQEGEFTYFFSKPTIENKDVLICPSKMRKDVPVEFETIKNHLSHIKAVLEGLEKFEYEVIKNALFDYATEHGRGIVLWAFRFTLSGKEKSADPFLIADIIGKDETIIRLKNAIEIL